MKQELSIVSPTTTVQVKNTIQVPSETPTPITYKVNLTKDLPAEFTNTLVLPTFFELAKDLPTDLSFITNCDDHIVSEWVFALVAPFATIRDSLTRSELMDIWGGKQSIPMVVTLETSQMLSSNWGETKNDKVKIVDEGNLVDAIKNQGYWAIVPFDQLQPQWKVIQIDDISPLGKKFAAADYALTMPICLQGNELAIKALEDSIINGGTRLISSNRDESQITTLLMTGTTALTRDIARKMDENGIDYPAEKILGWFQSADLVHISNEVSFKENCNLNDRLLFCSKLEYEQLLRDIGANVIELTGNHLLDFDSMPFLGTLDFYANNGMPYYGGGKDLEEARKPLLIENNGNKLAFIGCNMVGPTSDLATSSSPGANPCDRDWMKSTIQTLTLKGYLVIVTYQDLEGCDPIPVPAQRGNFIFAAEAGATIVSGSQAHCPQAMGFQNKAFIHYGLGNLFFDQMDALSRQEFLDRYTFYKNKLISIELLTAELEDHAQPRPMTEAERSALLERIFIASGWYK